MTLYVYTCHNALQAGEAISFSAHNIIIQIIGYDYRNMCVWITKLMIINLYFNLKGGYEDELLKVSDIFTSLFLNSNISTCSIYVQEWLPERF